MSEFFVIFKMILICMVVVLVVEKQLGNDKIVFNCVGFDIVVLILCKLSWICVCLLQGNVVQEFKVCLCENVLVMVCEEVFCLNIYECFFKGIVMFMIFGEVCMWCCLFCDVVYG